MAYSLPNQRATGLDPLLKGFDTGANFYNLLMQQARAREQSKRAESQNQRQEQLQPFNIKHLLAQTNSLTGSESRANQMLPLQLQAAKDAHLAALHKGDPSWELNNFITNMKKLGQMGNGGSDNQESAPNMDALKAKMTGQSPMNGGGTFPMQEEANPAMQNPIVNGQEGMGTAQENPMGIDFNNLNDAQKAYAATTKFKGIVNPGGVLHGPARDASDLERLRMQVGENSPVYQNAEAAYKANIDAKKDLRDLRARTKEGLKPGEKQFFDKETGEPLGKEIPLTAKERESEEGNILFNELYPYVYKGASPFSGEGSITRLENAARNYKTDPKARKMFDDFLLADKMLAATAVNEASTLKSGRTNQTYNLLKESLSAQDIPNVIKKMIKQYQIPASAQLKASMNYQKVLSDARKKARKSTPATQKLFYNPELQAQHEAQQTEANISTKEEIKELNGKKYKKINGEWHEVQ